MVRRGLIVLVLVGCGSKDSGSSAGSEQASAGTAGTTTGIPTELDGTGATSESTSGPADTGSAEDTGFATTSIVAPETTGEFESTSTGLVGDTDESIQCQSNDECESGMCYLMGIVGGYCSACLSDSDCRWGCSLPDPLTDPPTGATCSDGSMGGGCQTDGACMDPLLCGLVLDIQTVAEIRTCGECLSNADCNDGQLCSPDVRIAEMGGENRCVVPGSKADGETCDLDASGQECASTYCGSADIMGIVQIGVCSECDNATGAGCDPGQSCEAPSVGLEGPIVPGTCA